VFALAEADSVDLDDRVERLLSKLAATPPSGPSAAAAFMATMVICACVVAWARGS
jgi:short subunit fatty acids transporter